MAHDLDTLDRLSRPEENPFAVAFLRRNEVGAPVHPVREIDVQPAGRPVHNPRSRRDASETVRTRIQYAAISLGLYKPDGGATVFGMIVEKHATDEIASHFIRVALVEGTRQTADRGLQSVHNQAKTAFCTCILFSA